MRNYDLEFLKHFSMVIAFLAAVTLGLILFAHHLNGTMQRAPDPAAKQRVLDRIAPTGQVYAGATGAAAQAEALKAAAAAAASQVAPLSSRVFLTEVSMPSPYCCLSCNTATTFGLT